jgi:hypothetical protein
MKWSWQVNPRVRATWCSPFCWLAWSQRADLVTQIWLSFSTGEHIRAAYPVAEYVAGRELIVRNWREN